jgi:large subunit ribosomal protein L19
MNTAVRGVVTSPVNMTERASLGLRVGDTVRVHQKIQDKGKTRLQVFEGLVLARKHGDEPGATFTVRKVASGVGVEKIYPLYSPNIDKLEIVKRAKVRRAKLYYIREKVAREVKRQMRRMSVVGFSTESEMESAARAAAEAKAAEEAERKALEDAELKAKEAAALAEAQAAEAAAAEVVAEAPAPAAVEAAAEAPVEVAAEAAASVAPEVVAEEEVSIPEVVEAPVEAPAEVPAEIAPEAPAEPVAEVAPETEAKKD